MMKQTIKSPFRKLKFLLVLPMIAGVFYAFASPEYKFIRTENNNVVQESRTVTGKVISEDGEPLKGASVIVSGKTIGTVSDASGNFKLVLTDDSPLVISYVGFESQKVNADFGKEMVITMKTKIVEGNEATVSANASKPLEIPENVLIIIDGKESTRKGAYAISPELIESMNVLKGESAISKYGEKGKNGVIEITTTEREDKAENEKSSATKSFKVQANSPLNFGNPDGSGNQPLIVKDGVIVEGMNANKIPPETIESIDVLKGESATKIYGDKGKNGVILIRTKKGESAAQNTPIEVKVAGYGNDRKEITKDEGSVFTMVEELPEFQGGDRALRAYLMATMKYPTIALENGIQGQVIVGFIVGKNGEIKNVKVSRGVDPSLDTEAMRVVKSMPNWNPGRQNGESVEVAYEMPINFNMPADYHSKSKEKLRTNASLKIGNISWVNNTVFSSAELNKVLRMQKGDQYSKELINRRIWTDLDGVSSIYLDKGYAFSNIETSENPTNDGTVNLTFTVYEGKRAKIGKIDIKGNKSVSTEEILSKIAIKPGDLFSKTKIIQSVEALSKMGIFNSEEIKPAVIPNSQNSGGEFGTIDLVFNVKEI